MSFNVKVGGIRSNHYALQLKITNLAANSEPDLSVPYKTYLCKSYGKRMFILLHYKSKASEHNKRRQLCGVPIKLLQCS
jgi:hypothetical protein